MEPLSTHGRRRSLFGVRWLDTALYFFARRLSRRKKKSGVEPPHSKVLKKSCCRSSSQTVAWPRTMKEKSVGAWMRSAMHQPLAATGPTYGIVSRRGAGALRFAAMHPTRSQLPAEVVHRVEEARRIAAGPGVLHE